MSDKSNRTITSLSFDGHYQIGIKPVQRVIPGKGVWSDYTATFEGSCIALVHKSGEHGYLIPRSACCISWTADKPEHKAGPGRGHKKSREGLLDK